MASTDLRVRGGRTVVDACICLAGGCHGPGVLRRGRITLNPGALTGG